MDSQFYDELMEGELKDDGALVYMATERVPGVVKWRYVLYYDSYGWGAQLTNFRPLSALRLVALLMVSQQGGDPLPMIIKVA